MADLLQKSMSFIFFYLLIYFSVLHCSVSIPENADCDFPQFGATPVPPMPRSSNNPIDPWIPTQDFSPPFLFPNSPFIPWMPRQMTPPSVAPAQTNAPSFPQMPNAPLASTRPTASSPPQIARQLGPPPSTPAQTNSPSVPQIPRQLIPSPSLPRQSNTPFLPRRPAQIIPSPFRRGESNTGFLPQMPPQSGSSSSITPTQLQLGRQQFLLPTKSSSSSSRAKAVGTAVGVTLAITIIVVCISIFLILRCCRRRRRESQNRELAGGPPSVAGAGGGRNGKNLKGLIVDEKGQDMVYWRKNDNEVDKARNSFSTEAYDLYMERIKTKEKEKDNIPSISQQPPAPILKVNPRPESRSANVRFEPGDKKQQVHVQALAAPEPRLPPLWPSGRNKLSKHMDGEENLRPLQREQQVKADVDHSTKMGKLKGGSLCYDGDLMEAMFGSVATKRRTPKSAEDKSPTIPSINPSSSQIFLIDPRRSQHIANILRSVRISRQELLDALNEGKGLSADILENLSRIAPTKREESIILTYNGHPPSLAHAESFLYHTMKSVPFAFQRLNAMLFRSKYRTEIQHLDEHVHTLEKGCNELRESGLLLKLIEAVLTAGNNMNVGSLSGTAHSFNLTSLWMLYNVRSPDGMTTIIQSAVEEVAISEGKQCVLHRDNRLNMSRRNMDSSSSMSKQNSTKFMILGLPLLSGLSAEFPNAKHAATIDYYTYFFTASSTLTAGLADIRHTVRQCSSISNNDRGFVKEFTGFLEEARGEVRKKTEEQMKVIQLVRRTTEYYQSGATNDDACPFQLFATMKEFLDMVDQACIHISENLKRRKNIEENTGLVAARPKLS